MVSPKSTTRAFRVRVARDPVVVVALIVAILSATAATIQAILKQHFLLPTLLVTAASLLGALAKALPIWRAEQKRQREFEAGVFLDRSGRLPIVSEADLTDVFAVRRSLVNSLPYIERGNEDQVVEVLRANRPVLIVGPALVGKSRTGAEALRRAGGDLPVWSWRDPTTVATHLADKLPRDSAVWFDQLDRYLIVGAIDAVRVTMLAKNNLIVATMEQSVFEAFTSSATSSKGRELFKDRAAKIKIDATLATFTVVHLHREPLEVLKRLVAPLPNRKVADDICIAGGIGVYLGGGALAAKRYAYLHNNYPYAYGLVRAAVDWNRTGISESIPNDVARRLAVAYATALQLVSAGTAGPHGKRAWRKHERRATEWLAGHRSVRLLEGVTRDEPKQDAWAPFPYLTEVVTEDDPHPDIIRETWVEVTLTEAPLAQTFAAALAADDARQFDIAIALLKRLADRGIDTLSYIGLIYLRGLNDPPEAERWLQKAAEREDVWAMMLLAEMFKEISPEKAEAMWLKAARLGEPNAMFFLAVRASNKEEKLAWYQSAVALQHYPSMANLGFMLADEPGQQEAAETYLRTAAEAGNENGQTLFGCYLLHHDRAREARPFLESAAHAGEPHAMGDLGRMLIDEDLVQAEFWLRRGAEGGYEPAMNNLGSVIYPHRMGEAQEWFRRSAELGYVPAMKNLANVLRVRDPDEATEWWKKAAARGDAEAQSTLLASNGEPLSTRLSPSH